MPDPDLGSGRPFRYEWEQLLATLYPRLDTLEAAAGGGDGHTLRAAAVDGQSDPLLNLTYPNGSTALSYTLFDGSTEQGGQLSVQTGDLDKVLSLSAYPSLVTVAATDVDNSYAMLNLAGPAGNQTEIAAVDAFLAASNAQITLTAGIGHTQIYTRLCFLQSDPVLIVEASDGARVLTVYPDGDVELGTVGAGLILPDPDGGRHRLHVAVDGTLSTQPVP